MRFNILYNYVDGPFGGVNQFCKALRAEFVRRDLYAGSPCQADVIICNSFFFRALEFYDTLFHIRLRTPKVLFIHRLDGSLRLTRNDEASRIYDEAVVAWAKLASDGIVFQSTFSMRQQYEEGIPKNIPHAVIGNAPDPSLFYPATCPPPSPPWNLVYTSWSANLKKGFPTLRWLDEHLDFSRYAMTFVGNLPEGYVFRHVRIIPPQDSAALGEILRQQHIFVNLSHNEPCSNAILEAMHCGLPVLIRNSGGNSEFVPYGGAILYERDEDIPAILETICSQYMTLRAALHPPDIRHIADRYLKFAEELAATPRRKRASMLAYLRFKKQFSTIMPFNPARFLSEHLRGGRNA